MKRLYRTTDGSGLDNFNSSFRYFTSEEVKKEKIFVSERTGGNLWWVLVTEKDLTIK